MSRYMVIEPQPIQHPAWCTPDRCTATLRHHTGEAHRGRPVTVAANGIDRLVVTANLVQAHAVWPTETFVELQVSGLAQNWELVRGTATVPADTVRSLALALVELADAGLEENERQLLERLDVGTGA
jgi:hypothetical protein